ncbi:MAG TPA: EFR1 family ferrodoxin [Candidatus Dorea intestinavium]|nr:EFR1 family ferrodoxin [Candidatus Dorea intestinavium]
MIYYFSGTGNSLYVAQELAKSTGDEICSIAEILKGKALPASNGITGIVFPIYAWTLPKIVKDFLHTQKLASGYFYAVATCGGSCGKAMKHLEKEANRKLDAAFSLAMPNNYIIGGDVDTKENEAKKLAAAKEALPKIAAVIKKQKAGVYHVVEGSMAGVLSGVVAPIFHKVATSPKPFYAEDSCDSCGKCARVCPTQNIIVKGKPSWGDNCTTCFACMHYCPQKAIQRGKGTKTKGRYVNPNVQVKYNFKSL